jgi:hypothetical protein
MFIYVARRGSWRSMMHKGDSAAELVDDDAGCSQKRAEQMQTTLVEREMVCPYVFIYRREQVIKRGILREENK